MNGHHEVQQQERKCEDCGREHWELCAAKDDFENRIKALEQAEKVRIEKAEADRLQKIKDKKADRQFTINIMLTVALALFSFLGAVYVATMERPKHGVHENTPGSHFEAGADRGGGGGSNGGGVRDDGVKGRHDPRE